MINNPIFWFGCAFLAAGLFMLGLILFGPWRPK